MTALQIAPARRQAGKELLANDVQGLVIRSRAGLQGIRLAHQFDQPGVGGNRLVQ